MQPDLISPFQTGLDLDTPDWLAPKDSFSELQNFHIKHNRVEKRGGYRLFGYMVHNPATAITNVTSASPASVTAAGHGLSTGNQVLISNIAWAGGETTLNNQIFTITVVDPNTFTLTGGDASAVTYSSGGRVALFDGNRIMGIERYIFSDGTKDLLIFDTERAAIYDSGNDVFNPLDAADIMSGDVENYIWQTNWQNSGGTNRIYFTNGKQWDGANLDGIRYYDPSASTTATQALRPNLNGGGTRVLYGCNMLFVIKKRLICLFTYELDTTVITHPQRARWCRGQDPASWRDDTPGQGGYTDAPTGEQIISARQIQDALIVYFTDSVWTLRYTADPRLPFRWDKINDFRSCNGRMASTEYDANILAVGDRGITASDGSSTRRIDERIQDFTSESVDPAYWSKVYAKRDYNNRRLWILYPSGSGGGENDNALIRDDETGAFSTYQIALNCLGYGNLGYDFTFENFTEENGLDYAFEDFNNNETFSSYFFQDQAEIILGGNTSGVVYILSTTGSDVGTEIECTFTTNAWNPYQAEGREAQLNYVDIFAFTDPNAFIEIDFYKDTDEVPYINQTTDLLPPLGYIASINDISQANPANVQAGNHGLSTGDVVYIYGVKGMVEIYGQFTVTRVDANNFTLDGEDSTTYDAYTQGGQIFKKEYYRTRVWKRIIAGGIGNQHRMTLRNTGANEFITIEAFKPHFRPRGRRTIN